MLARLVSYAVLLSFSAQALAYLCCDLTLIPISGGVAFPFFTFGIKTILLNMLQLGFLLSTLPESTRDNYLEKLSVCIRFWHEKGGCLSEATIAKLKDAGIKIEVGDSSPSRTDKKPGRMDYLDDMDIPEFKQLPTFKRICICIMKNDHACKYMGFSPNKTEKQRRAKIMEKYESLQSDRN